MTSLRLIRWSEGPETLPSRSSAYWRSNAGPVTIVTRASVPQN